jgi:hypothetical protein
MNGTIVSEKGTVLNTWKEYFPELLSCEEVMEMGEEMLQTNEEEAPVAELTQDESVVYKKYKKMGKPQEGR